MKLAVGLALPFVLSLVLAGAIRLSGGPERGARAAGASVVVAFLIGWGALWRPGWVPAEPFARIGHIALGALLVGLLVDVVLRRRIASFIGAAGVVLVSVWASVMGTLRAAPVAPQSLMVIAGLSLVALLVLARLDRLRLQGNGLVVLGMLALAFAAVGFVVHDVPLAGTALMLALATAAYALIAALLALPTGDAIVLGVGASILAIAWALSVRDPSTRLAMTLIPLVLFADGTARRVPLPNARISTVLAPLVLAGIAALPLLLAALVAYVTQP